MAESQQTLERLGSSIAELSKSLASQLQALNHPEPSFAPNAPPSLPQTPKIQAARLQLMDSLMSFLHLLTGPREFWLHQLLFVGVTLEFDAHLTTLYDYETERFTITKLNNESLTINVLNRFNFWDAVPLAGSASYAEIAKTTNLPEQIVRRFLRMAFTMFIFTEEALGSDRVVHTSASAHIAKEPLYKSFIAHGTDDLRPAATVGVDALERWWVGQQEPPQDIKQCAFVLATDDGRQRDKNFWEFVENFERPGKPKGYRSTQFAETMEVLGDITKDGMEAVLEKFDWEGLGEATVVDVR